MKEMLTNKLLTGLSDAEFARRVKPRSPTEMEAEASFKLGVWFEQAGKPALAAKYFERAQQLNPDDWNYHRQDWLGTEGLVGPKYKAKRDALGDKPYYAPLEIPPTGDASGGDRR